MRNPYVNPAFTPEATATFDGLLEQQTEFKVPRRPKRPEAQKDLTDWFFRAFRGLWRVNKYYIDYQRRDIRHVFSLGNEPPYVVLTNTYRGLRIGEPSDNEKRVVLGVQEYTLFNTYDRHVAQQATMGRVMMSASSLAVCRAYDYPDYTQQSTNAFVNGENIDKFPRLSIDDAIEAVSTNYKQLRALAN